jgi:hypothetical protein
MPTPTGRASRKRYCNVECRKAAWRQRHRDDPNNADVVPHNVPGVLAVSTASRDDVPVRGGQHRCPHCRQPLAIISVVIPADAAVVKPPEVLPLTTQATANLNSPPGEDDLANLGNFDERQQAGTNTTRAPRRRNQAASGTHALRVGSITTSTSPGSVPAGSIDHSC